MTSMEPAASVFAHISPINKDRGATSVFPLVRSPQRRPGGSRDPVDEEAGVARGAPGPRGEGGTCANAVLAFAYIFVSGSMILINAGLGARSLPEPRVIKSTNVVWTYAACLVLGLRTFSLLDFSNLFLIVAGVSVACVEGPKTGCSTYGVFLAFSGIVVEGFRLAAMEKLLASRHIVLSPTTYLYYVAPANAVGLFLVAVATGEWTAFAAAGYATPPLRVLALNCAFAFALNGLGLVVIRRLGRVLRPRASRAAAVVDEKKARKRTAT
ncbi:hypothetical protein JL720_6735 [Aureococcus anophagefferens]|nr:hypothetical protein JL720_6735 [Aureococcus anophagefferens]